MKKLILVAALAASVAAQAQDIKGISIGMDEKKVNAIVESHLPEGKNTMFFTVGKVRPTNFPWFMYTKGKFEVHGLPF